MGTITVTVTNFDPDNRTATFAYSGTDSDSAGAINPPTGVVTVYTFTPAPDSPWTPAPPLTPMPAADWITIDGWSMTVDGTNLGQGAAAGYRLTVVFQGQSYVNDPTIIMVDPPKIVPLTASGGDKAAVLAA